MRRTHQLARLDRAFLPLFGCFVCALVLLVSSRAYAYEDQASLGVGLGYANAVSNALPAHGGMVSLDASLGIDDIWTLHAQLGFGLHPETSPLSVFLANTELLYLVDVFELVPYFGGGIDGIGAMRNAALSIDMGVHPVFGLDWLPERNLAFGIAVRPIFLITALDQDPVYLTVSVSGSLLFDL